MNYLHLVQEDLNSLDHDGLNEMMQAEEENTKRAQMEALGNRFEQRFKKGSWLQLKWPKRKAAERRTYIFHAISGSGAMYAFYLLLGVLAWSWLGALLALVVIVLHEREKRRWSDKFWDSFVANPKQLNWKALSINLSLFAASLLLTVGGAYFGLKDNMPGAQQVGVSSDPVAMALQQQLDEARDDLKAFEENPSNYNGKGQMYYKRMDTWNGLQEKVNATEAQLKSQFGIITIQNTDILNEWLQKRWFVVLIGVLICLLSEIGFEYNMHFRSLYDYRYYLAKKSQLSRSSPTNGVPMNGQKKSLVAS